MIPSNIALLDKTEITAKTQFLEATLVVAKTDAGYSCGLWGNAPGADPQYITSQKFGANTNAIAKAAVLAPLLIQAKEYVGATAEKYPEGLLISIRVEHGGKTHTLDGKLPLHKNQLAQFAALLDWVKQVNAVVNKG